MALLQVMLPAGERRYLRDCGILTLPLAQLNVVLAPLGYVLVGTKTRSAARFVLCTDTHGQVARYGPSESEDTVMACQVVFLPPHIVWIKGLIFFYDRPRDMEQLPSGGTPSNFLWLPGRAQPAIEGLDDGVMLHGTQRRHIQCSPYKAGHNILYMSAE